MPGDRFADRDMLMRYHWGLGIGHAYAQEAKLPQNSATPDGEADDTNVLDGEESASTWHQAVALGEGIQDPGVDHGDGDNPEPGMGIQDEYEDEFSGQSGSDLESESWDDEEHLELMETYYTDY